MSLSQVGKLERRYSFVLNPHREIRVSKCPKCGRPTHARKFPLFIHIDDWGPLTLGKTCRYCSRCELIICHQDELEAQLAHVFSSLAPAVIGATYLVLGTVEKGHWQQFIDTPGCHVDELLAHMADFKEVLDLHFEPAGWYPADPQEPERQS